MSDTPITSIEDVQRIARETIRAERGAVHEGTTTTTSGGDPAAPLRPKAEPVTISDAAIGLDVLTRQTGSREAALEQIALNPTTLGSMKGAIARRRQELEEQAEAEAKAAYLRSP